jgi:hypothetical protein
VEIQSNTATGLGYTGATMTKIVAALLVGTKNAVERKESAIQSATAQ